MEFVSSGSIVEMYHPMTTKKHKKASGARRREDGSPAGPRLGSARLGSRQPRVSHQINRRVSLIGGVTMNTSDWGRGAPCDGWHPQPCEFISAARLAERRFRSSAVVISVRQQAFCWGIRQVREVLGEHSEKPRRYHLSQPPLHRLLLDALPFAA